MAITTLYSTGWEHGLASASGAGLFDAVQSATINSTTPRNGTFCGDVNCALNGFAFFTHSVTAAPNKYVCRVGILAVTLPSSQTTIFEINNSGTNQLSLQVNAAGDLFLIWSTGGTATGPTATLNTSTYTLVEIQVDLTAGTADWKINGVAQPQATGGPTGVTVATTRCGRNAASGAAFEMRYDDWIVGSFTVSTDWYGDGKGIKILPGSDGTHSFTTGDFSPGDAGATQASTWSTAWQNVDDAPPWTTGRLTTDNIAQRVAFTTNTAHYVEIVPAATPETGTANAVRALLAYSASGTASDTMGCIVRDSAGAVSVLWGNLSNASGGTGGTASPFGTADYSESTNFFKDVEVTPPVAGWTPTEVNAIRWRLGSSTDVSPIPTVQALMLEVDYPIVVASTQIPVWRARMPVVRPASISAARFT